ncbi:flagellar motor protein MotB [Phenylobacterium sp.]|jgi:chemotaxis protein MotB|uniref:flagellar motor protein MotB n=1 Tax=Phenylobacterium sp. TaxID=1871053 RepID=UPI00261E5F02|nr:flagellar motor protein MotB [Phenylobacterium sp.]
MSMSGERPIIIKRIKRSSGPGHHGGAWKVAYADFVTAMMAFFLLMWLINTTSPEQKRGIADYFAPASVSETTSGSGGILAGTALGNEGAKQNGSQSIIQDASPDSRHPNDGKSRDGAKSAASDQATSDVVKEQQQKQREAAAFASAAQSLRQALQDMPELAELSKNIIIDQTPEGLRIQLVDQEGRSMFNQGTATPNDRAKLLLRAIAKIINQLPNRISIYGHTSANAGQGGKAEGDWTLSAARADASRRILQVAGVDADRIYQVSGKATSEPLYPDDPTLPGNRRIAIVLLREAPVLPPDKGL